MKRKLLGLVVACSLLFGNMVPVMAAEGDNTNVFTWNKTGAESGEYSSASVTVIADNSAATNFAVELPKKAVLTDPDGDGIFTGTFTEKVTGDVPGGWGVSIGFKEGSKFEIKQDGKTSVPFTISANFKGSTLDHTTRACEWLVGDIMAASPVVSTCTVTTSKKLTAGEWKQNLTFKITYGPVVQ